MTEAASPPPETPAAGQPQNLALIKAVTVGLGLLLIGGVILLCVLLVTRGGEDGAAASGLADDDYVLEATLMPGERIVSTAGLHDALMLRIEGPSGERFVILHQDGRRGEVRVRTVAQP